MSSTVGSSKDSQPHKSADKDSPELSAHSGHKEAKIKDKSSKKVSGDSKHDLETSSSNKDVEKVKEKRKKKGLEKDLEELSVDGDGALVSANKDGAPSSSKHKSKKNRHVEPVDGVVEPEDGIEASSSHSKGFMSKLGLWKKKKDGRQLDKTQSEISNGSLTVSGHASPRGPAHDKEEEEALAALLVTGHGIAGRHHHGQHAELNAAEYLRAMTQSPSVTGVQQVDARAKNASNANLPSGLASPPMPISHIGPQASFMQSRLIIAPKNAAEPFSDSQAHLVEASGVLDAPPLTASTGGATNGYPSIISTLSTRSSSSLALQVADTLASAAVQGGDNLAASPKPIRSSTSTHPRDSSSFHINTADSKSISISDHKDLTSSKKPSTMTPSSSSTAIAQEKSKVASRGGSTMGVVTSDASGAGERTSSGAQTSSSSSSAAARRQKEPSSTDIAVSYAGRHGKDSPRTDGGDEILEVEDSSYRKATGKPGELFSATRGDSGVATVKEGESEKQQHHHLFTHFFHSKRSPSKDSAPPASSELGQYFYSRVAGEAVDSEHLRIEHEKELDRAKKKKEHDAESKPKDVMKFNRDDGRFKFNGHVTRIPIDDDKKDSYEIVKFSHNSWSGVRYYWVPEGEGRLCVITGEVRYIGSWKKGVRQGEGEGSFELGGTPGVYSGDWKSGKPGGRGRFLTKRFRFEGGWKDGLRHGFGEYVKERLQYVGDWIEDKKFGYGIATYADGTRYEGEWEKDQRSGFGVCRYPDGSIYTGVWNDNFRNGQGTCIYANGNRYVGEWYKDMKQGKGVLYGALDQKLYEGNWWRNKRHGQGIGWFLDTGDRYEGEWFLGKQHGEGDWFGADGSSYKGSYVDGFRHGTGLVVYASGDRYVGEWVRGIREGTLCAYVYADYGKFVGPYVADKASGQGEYITFANRKIAGAFEWTILEDDMGRYSGLTLSGKRFGRGIQVYKNGDRYDGEWRDGMRYGYGVMQYEDGGRYVGFWLKDERSKLGTYSLPDGEKYVGRWLKDKRHGTGTMIFENKDRLVDVEWVDDAPLDGPGTYVFANKSVYRGPLQNGLPEGRGSLTLLISSLLKERAEYRKKVGLHFFLRGERHSTHKDLDVETTEEEDTMEDITAYVDAARKNKGVPPLAICQPNSITFWREFRGGRMLDGPGLSIWDGNSYEGDFVGFERYGVGRMTRTTGETYFGQWKHDREWGLGEVRTRSADVYVGYWYNGFRNGVGSQHYDEGGTYYGKWMNDRRHGIGLFLWPDKTFTTREYYRGEFVAKRVPEDSWVKKQLAQWEVEKFSELVKSLPYAYPKWAEGPMPDFYLEAVMVNRSNDWEEGTLTLDAVRSSRGGIQ